MHISKAFSSDVVKICAAALGTSSGSRQFCVSALAFEHLGARIALQSLSARNLMSQWLRPPTLERVRSAARAHRPHFNLLRAKFDFRRIASFARRHAMFIAQVMNFVYVTPQNSEHWFQQLETRRFQHLFSTAPKKWKIST